MKSKFFNLTWKDLTKGIILSIIIGSITFLTELTSTEVDWKKLLITIVITILGYLLKNLFTNSKDKFLKQESPKDK